MDYIGLKRRSPAYAFETDAYGEIQMIVVTSGRLFMAAEGRETRLDPGSVLVLRRGGAFRLFTGPRQGYGGVCWIDRDDDTLHGSALAGRASDALQIVTRQIEQEASAPQRHGQKVLRGLGEAFRWLAQRSVEADTPTRTAEEYARYWAERARERIDASIYTGEPVGSLLQGMGLSYRQLARHFTTILGQSPKAYQLARRLEEARRQLVQSDMPITAVAFELGFPSSQHFANQFRHAFGTTPSACRLSGRHGL